MHEKTWNWVLIDGNYLAHKAWHTTGHLRRGVVFGFLKQLVAVSGTSKVVVAFDRTHCGRNFRRELTETYKANRRSKKQSEHAVDKRAQMREFFEQLKELVLCLRDLTVTTIAIDGFEGDDIIGFAVKCLGKGEKAVIVASDEDYFQLLDGAKVRMLHYNEVDLLLQYDITPNEWINAKCLAGCASDNVIGLDRVGIKTACRIINGQGSRKQQQRCFEFIETEQYKLNRMLVELPLNCDKFRKEIDAAQQEVEIAMSTAVSLDEIPDHLWNHFCMKYEMQSLKRG